MSAVEWAQKLTITFAFLCGFTVLTFGFFGRVGDVFADFAIPTTAALAGLCGIAWIWLS